MKNKFYSQYNQDEIILKILNFKRNGVFVDIGANDGINLSNTYYMEKKLGWNGLCIESDSRAAEELKKNRNCSLELSPVSPKSGMITKVYEHNDSLLSAVTFEGNGIIKEDGTTVSEEELKNATGISINDALEKHNIPKNIDYISMDIEGWEPGILETFDFNKYNVNCWSIEWSNGSTNYNAKYYIAHILFQNDYAVKQHHSDFIAWR